MDISQKMEHLGKASVHDLCGEPALPVAGVKPRGLSHGISTLQMPGGGGTTVLKVLLSTVCENDCAYCAIRAARDVPRISFSPEELAQCFDAMWRAGLVEGLFLSSGVSYNVVREMDRMLATVELVRQRYTFSGYVHLKLLPGASADQVEMAVRLADRVSANLETVDARRLASLSLKKDFESGPLANLVTAARIVRRSQGQLAHSGITTQFVVGASDESDRELLQATSRLYQGLGLTRAYYSAFTPIPDTPLEDRSPTPVLRQHRLYQSDFLLRRYGYQVEELVFDASGNLPMRRDPKEAWAQAHPEFFPLEINRAERDALLRVPGLGPILAERIIQERRQRRLTDLTQLSKMGICAERAAPYITLAGRLPARQLSFWSTHDAHDSNGDPDARPV